MSEKSDLNSNSLVNITAPKFLENALSEPANEIGHTLANIFHVIFGPLNYPVEKYRIRQALNLKKYEEELQIQINKIPDEHLVEPPLSIVGPALEASKFHIEEEDLRQMFTKLIAASMDDRQTSKLHPSYIEIIKQLSPLDAQNLKSFGNDANAPIVNYVNFIGFDRSYFYKDIYLAKRDFTDLSQISSSITNLNRLGILTVDYTSQLSDINYDNYREHDFFVKLKKDFSSLEQQEENRNSFELPRIEIEKGIVELTQFGLAFKQVCL